MLTKVLVLFVNSLRQHLRQHVVLSAMGGHACSSAGNVCLHPGIHCHCVGGWMNVPVHSAAGALFSYSEEMNTICQLRAQTG